MEYENTLINEKLAPVVPKNLKKFKSGMKLPTETLWWSKMDSIEDNPLIDLTPEVTCTMKNGLFDGPFDLKKASNTLHIDFKNSKLHGNLLLHSDDVIIDATYFNGLPVSSHINEKGEESVSRYIDGKIVYEKKLIDGKKVKKTKYYF
jgi:hypothetical protein